MLNTRPMAGDVYLDGMGGGEVRTGYWGVPNTMKSTKIHIQVETQRALCGKRFTNAYQFQFCYNGVDISMVECAECKKAWREAK